MDSVGDLKKPLFLRGWVDLCGLACTEPFVEENNPEAFIEDSCKPGRWSARVLYPFSSVLPGRQADTRLLILNRAGSGRHNYPEYKTPIHLQNKNQAGGWESVARYTRQAFSFQLEADPDFPVAQPPGILEFARLAWSAKLDRPNLQGINDRTIAMRG